MKDKILEILENSEKKMTVYEIQSKLNEKNINVVIDALNSLEKEYKVFKTNRERYMLFERNSFVRVGNLAMNKKGFGFLISESPEQKDLYINGANLNGATDGDRVLVSVNPTDNSAKVEKIIKRDVDDLVGEICFDGNKAYLKLDDEKKKMRILVKGDKVKDVVDGTKVKVKITKEKSSATFIAEIERIIGHKDDPGVDILSIALKYGIDNEFPKEVEVQTESIQTEVLDADKKGRIDLTDKVIFTIDGDDTKDIDDAISIDKEGDLYVLGVHIADVSYYVKENTPLDVEAYERGTSSYLANSVIPMLPHKLSNGICSLNPNVERLTQSCVMKINNKGEIVSSKIFESIIKSNIQMTYKKVNAFLQDGVIAEGYEPFTEKLSLMLELSKILRKNKIARGYLAFDLKEAKIICDENGKAIDIITRTQEEGESLIEDFMIAANETVAKTITDMNLPFVYRTHDKPNPEKVTDFMNFAVPFGFKLQEPLEEYSPKAIQSILNEISTFENSEILSEVLLRSMRKALYTANNIGHFGLGSTCYTHFTSPIRRYPDLMVHRLLRKYLYNNDKNISSLPEKLASATEHCSMREQAAVEAEREVESMKMAEYMEAHIGEEFEGVINGVTNFGMFVKLHNQVEGLVHVSALNDDFYNYNEKLLTMTGEAKGKVYRLGDKIKVKVVAAKKENGDIDFTIVE